jgi:hypothetical protein
MLTRFKSRRLMAVLGIAAMTDAAGLLAAQPAVPNTTNRTPKLISNCDVTQQSCGGDPTLGGGGTFGGWTAPEEKPVCWTGTKNPCGRDSTRMCLQYVPNSGSGSVSVTGGATPGGSISGSASGTCISYTVIVRTYTWSK